MFRANQAHQQPQLLSTVNALPEKVRERLEQSWGGTFYRQCFCRIDEASFAVLYADKSSRPNTPVTVLVGLEILKAGFGWSDEELHDSFLYDVQVRYALGYDELGEGLFELRTLYNFRRRLSQYANEHGVNLLDKAFQHVTDGQVLSFQVHSQTLRMDSTQIASNMLDASRLNLLVEGVRRLYRLLDRREQSQCDGLCAPYLKQETDLYVHGIKGKAATVTSLTAVGDVLAQMLSHMRLQHATEPVYRTVAQLFADNYHVKAASVHPRAIDEIESGALQSLDDMEAFHISHPQFVRE